MANAVIGALRVVLGMNTAAFEEGVGLTQRKLRGLQKDVARTGDKFVDMGKKLSIGITLPVVAFGTQAAKAAIDAEELQAAFGETFGEMSASMDKWAEATGNAMGRSTQEMQRGAMTLGMLFNQSAKTREEAALMSQQFTVLAQDLSSFFNVDYETALQSLRSGLSGEAEPLRKFGVFLNEAAVSAKAAEMGIVGLNGKLTDQQKIMVRAALIMDATAKAQGDVERTSGSTANQIRAAQTAWQELSVTVGTKLLPALTPIVEKLGQALEWFSKLSPATQSFLVISAGAGAAFGPLLAGVGGLLKGFSALLPLLVKLGPLFSALGPLIMTVGRSLAMLAIAGGPITLAIAAAGALYLAFKNWDKIKPILIALYNGVKTWLVDKLGAVWGWVTGKIESVKKAFYNLYDAVVGHSYIPDMVDEIGDHMARLDRNMVDPAESATSKTAESFANLAQSVIGSVQGIGRSLKSGNWLDALSGVIGVVSQVAGAFGGGGSKVKSSVNSVAAHAVNFGRLPGWANGGSGVLGGLGGVDRNVLSLNGSPIARVSKGERFAVSPQNDNGRQHVHVTVTPSPLFDVKIEQAKVGGALGGMQLTQQRMARAQSRRLG